MKIHPYIHPNPLVTPMNCHKLSTWIFSSNHLVLILVALKKSACKADVAPKQYSITGFLMLYCNHSYVRTCGSIKQKTSRKHLQSKQHVDSITFTAEKNRFTKDFADSELRWIYPSASTTKRSVFQQRHHGSDDAVVHVLWTHQLEGKPWDLAQKRANNLSSVLQSHANLIFQLGLLAPTWRSKTHEGIEESNLFEGLKRARNISFYLHSLEL